MPPCRFWKDQPDGFHGYCQHPKAQSGDPCILNTEDECLLREEYPVCSECGRRVDISSVPEKVDSYICEVCASYVTVTPGAGIVEELEAVHTCAVCGHFQKSSDQNDHIDLEAVHTCAVCGHTMSSAEYEAKGCIFCGADSEEEQ